MIKISFNIIIKHLHVYNVLLWSFQRLVLGLTKITIFTDEKDRLNDMILSSQGTISWLSWYSTSNRNTPELSGTIVDVISSPDTMNLQHSCVLYHYWYAHILCGAGSMHLSGVRPSVLPSVHQSVCPSMGQQQQTRWCMFAAVGPADMRYRSIAARRTAARRIASECG